MTSGILLVAAQRELRRSLFDVFDHAGFAHIHSARDVTHAAILLEGRPPLSLLQLVVVVFSSDAQQARHCCEQLHSMAGTADTPLIAVLTSEATLDPADLPAVVTDWLHVTQISTELVARWQRTQKALLQPPRVGARA